MIGLLVLVVLAVVMWKLVSPGEQFLSGFAELLANRRIDRSPFSFFSGRSYVAGKHHDRDVVVRLQLKRTKYGQGYLVIAVRTRGSLTLDAGGIDAHVADDFGRRALASIAAHDLLLSVEDGWLKALWQPQGFTIFPGRFAPEKWRQVLDALQVVAGSLDAAATT